ncbi:translation initiation factor [bacterium]|nr:translation initiation factor [bacterium]
MSKKNRRSDGLVFSTGPSPIDWEGEKDSQSDAKPSGKETAVLRLEKKGRGGKAVTVIQFRGTAGARILEVGKSLKAACGVGGTTKGDLAELQGDQRDKIRALLEKDGFLVKG